MGKWRILRRDGKDGETRVLGFWPRARLSYLANPRLIGMSAPSLAGIAICHDFNEKMGDFEAGWQGNLTQGKRVEASRATKFLSKSSAHR